MFRAPRPKKYAKHNENLPLPVFEANEELLRFSGDFNGFSIIIKNNDERLKVYLNGNFGKGNLSRSFPNFVDSNETSIIRKRQFENRKSWVAKAKGQKILVVPDSDSETEEYFKNLQPEYRIDTANLKENLHLSLEEAFFLLDAVKCLDIHHNNHLLNAQDAWGVFCECDEFFRQNYATYYYYRSKNWVVKPGLKFGGDYLLYKEGPAFYHASYVVIIDVIDAKTLERKEELCHRSMDTHKIVGLHRLCETAGKELLICQLLWPDVLIKGLNDIKKIGIKEVLMRRWLQSNEAEDT